MKTVAEALEDEYERAFALSNDEELVSKGIMNIMEEKIRVLKTKLENIGTRDLLGMIGIRFLTFANGANDFAEQSEISIKTKLTSPQKQYTYLAGLLMSTEDKSNGRITKEEDSGIYDELENNVQEITLEYTKNFLNIKKSNGSDIKRNLVSMEAFVSYFDTGILRYPEQTIELIRVLYSSFDSELESIIGLTIEDLIAFYQLVYDEFENAITSSKYAVDKIKELSNFLNPYAIDVEKEYERLLIFAQGYVSNNLQNVMDNLNSIKAAAVIEKFGKNKGEKLLSIFGLYREPRDFSYYNGKNPFAESPLCWIDDGETLFIVHPHLLLNAIFNCITDTLENPQNKFADKYKKKQSRNCRKPIY